MSTSKFEIDNEKSLTISQCVQKRLFDVIFSICGIVIFFIIIFIAWIVASIDTKSNGFFCQTRIGRNGKKFTMYKIKTMINSDTNNTSVTTRNDPRITKIGGFFRRTKIDELPQLFSILKGDMSFVGPRPALFNQEDLIALRVDKGVSQLLPGITGWAQINGRDHLSIKDKVRLDEEYLYRKSFWFDLSILYKTAKRVIGSKGISH